MKVLSLMEPWASLVKENIKLIETRSWKTNYRGELYIHTSKKKITKLDRDNLKEQLNLLPSVSDFKYGYIIAKCKLLDCTYMDEKFVSDIKNNKIEYLCGDYKVGRYAWILSEVQILKRPIQAKGHLGIWNYTDDEISV